MKMIATTVTVKFEDGDVPDYKGAYAVKAIRPHSMEMKYFAPNDYQPDGQRFGDVLGWQVKKDGSAGSVTATHHTAIRAGEWPEWMTALFDRYQPTWEGVPTDAA